MHFLKDWKENAPATKGPLSFETVTKAAGGSDHTRAHVDSKITGHALELRRRHPNTSGAAHARSRQPCGAVRPDRRRRRRPDDGLRRLGRDAPRRREALVGSGGGAERRMLGIVVELPGYVDPPWGLRRHWARRRPATSRSARRA